MPPRKRKQQAVPEASTAGDIQPAKLKVAELRAELEDRGLETGGKKAELVARLEAALRGEGPSASKKAKEEEETDFQKAVKALKVSEGEGKKVSKKKKRQPKVDPHVRGGAGLSVEGDWDCMLNQTNIGQNNNKYYVIQMLTRGPSGPYQVWTRWGRVGEPGQHAMKGPFSKKDAAEKEFCKKFKDKTRNDWEERGNFTPVPGKYTLIEMDDEDEDEEEVRSKLAALEETDAPTKIVKPCQLDKPTQALLKLIFDNDMFNDAMKSMEIDTKKMPLGKLSRTQIAKGFEALEAIEDALNSLAPRSRLAELSSKFYTIIPHDFGRCVPPVIADHETLQKKFDMLLVLGDIEIAQGLKKEEEKREKETSGDEVPHPLDLNYELLKAKLSHLDKRGDEFGIIQTYLKSTEPTWRKLEIQDIWAVDRDGESKRFAEHGSIENRRLLWHGTNVAVVAAILKSGLRIMPHSGGRVGKGIYFASENSKSAGYVRCNNNIGIMLLNEVALGKEHHITKDDPRITTPPKGFDSVVAKGRTEPDPKADITVTMDGKAVTVPQGKPLDMPMYSSSYFSQSEYLVYRESQARIRYLLKLRFQY